MSDPDKMDDIKRKEDGTFAKGSTPNPEGRGAKDSPWQPFGQRCQHWMNKLTRKELKALVQDQEAMDKLSSYDAMVVTAIVDSLVGKDRGRERERVLNRIEGKPTETVIVRKGSDDYTISNDPQEAANAYKKIMGG